MNRIFIFQEVNIYHHFVFIFIILSFLYYYKLMIYIKKILLFVLIRSLKFWIERFFTKFCVRIIDKKQNTFWTCRRLYYQRFLLEDYIIILWKIIFIKANIVINYRIYNYRKDNYVFQWNEHNCKYYLC